MEFHTFQNIYINKIEYKCIIEFFWKSIKTNRNRCKFVNRCRESVGKIEMQDSFKIV